MDEKLYFLPPTAGTAVTPNYLRSPKISVSPYCDCSNSGNNKDECDKFTEFFTENTCLRKSALYPAADRLLLILFSSIQPCSTLIVSVLLSSALLLSIFTHSASHLALLSPLFIPCLSFSCSPLLTKYIPSPCLHCYPPAL